MADPGTLALVAMGVGAAAEGVGSIISGNERAKAARKQADLDDAQATEIERRAKVSEEFMLYQKDQEQGNAVSAFAKAGVDLSGSALLVLEEQAHWMQREIDEMSRAERYQAEQVRKGAQSARNAAGTYQTIGYLGAGGSLLRGVGSIYMARDK